MVGDFGITKSAARKISRGNRPRGYIDGLAYKTRLGKACVGDSYEMFGSADFRRFRRRAQLILTSPPFPLVTKKRYGNLGGDEYVDWLVRVIGRCMTALKDDGSLVIEMGNAWCRGIPAMSTLPIKALLEVQEQLGLHLCQEFVWHNPARLPGPAQWVNVERIRLKDAFTRFWWLSASPTPKANNRNVLTPYSDKMVSLLEQNRRTAGARPSQHKIRPDGFLSNNGGAISPNVLVYPNTRSVDPYLEYCQTNGLQSHPARMPVALAEFFIKFLTDKRDLVVDPFSGSNITGRAAENQKRRWLSVEIDEEYVRGSLGRFKGEGKLEVVRCWRKKPPRRK